MIKERIENGMEFPLMSVRDLREPLKTRFQYFPCFPKMIVGKI